MNLVIPYHFCIAVVMSMIQNTLFLCLDKLRLKAATSLATEHTNVKDIRGYIIAHQASYNIATKNVI